MTTAQTAGPRACALLACCRPAPFNGSQLFHAQKASVPASWEFASNKKGVKRYTCPALRELVRAREAAYDAKERAQGGILQASAWPTTALCYVCCPLLQRTAASLLWPCLPWEGDRSRRHPRCLKERHQPSTTHRQKPMLFCPWSRA